MVSKLRRFWKILSHPRELRMALSGLGVALSGDSAGGGLLECETAALVSWVRDSGVKTFVEIGTLFGFTARRVMRETGVRTVAVDDFSWNPFGLTSDRHEAFTRRILEGSEVEMLRMRSEDFLASFPGVDAANALVFLDGSHAYEDVKKEISLCVERGVSVIAGHDFGNPAFGVTRAVSEAFGAPDEVIGSCWLKRLRV